MIQVVVAELEPLLTIDEAKAHLHVEDDDQDDLIELYADAAVQSCLTYCNQKLVPVGAEPSFKAAALLNLGGLYAQRESVVAGGSYSVNPAAAALLNPFRIMFI